MAFGVILLSYSLFSFQKASFDLKASMDRGKEIYLAYCITCHMENGEGIPTIYPPLAKSDYLMADKKRAIKQVLEGANGEMIVNGITYNNQMAAFPLPDQEVSDVLNYIRNTWGNVGDPILPQQVKVERQELAEKIK